jgi:3-hydroxy-5-methyl-1-naphthoate 3-O-methyltransferase
MRELAEETARGQRGDTYGSRRPMVGPGARAHGPGPRREPGGRYGERGPSPRVGGYSKGFRDQGGYGGPRVERAPSGPRHDRPHSDRPRPERAHPDRPYEDRPERTRTERPHRDREQHGRKPYRTGVQSAGEGPPRPVPALEQPVLGRLRLLLSGYQSTAAVLAAYSLGVFRHLHQKPQILGDLTRATGADPRGMEALLDALVGLGLVHRHGATYVLPRDVAPYLVPGVDGDATGLVEMTSDLYMAWMDLARGLKEGAPRYRLSSDALLAGDPERVRRYIRGTHTTGREAARRLIEMAPLLPGSTLLDVGGGSGIFAAEYARRTPGLKAILFDLPPTLEVAREILEREESGDLVEFVPGDYRNDSFPAPVDAILLSNVLQTESEENAVGILRRSHEALRPGGTLLVHGSMGDGGAVPEPPLALASLFFYVLFDQGRAWSIDRVSEWLAKEGFGVRSAKPLGAPFHTRLIVATRME